MITLTAQFTMLPGKESLALSRVAAVKAQTDAEQPGTLLYLVHRVLDRNSAPTDTLLFYECYRDQDALNAHLACSTWKALVAGWSECFVGTQADTVLMFLDRIDGFVHLQAP